MTTTIKTKDLTADEYALYDRQVRLWGAQAQQLIGSSHVLIISMRALGTEISKNLTLAGIESLTIIDDGLVTEEDLGACYFLREEDIGQPRADSAIPRLRELNPGVKIQSGGSFATIPLGDDTYFTQFTMIVACDLDLDTLSLINSAARLASRPFYAAGIHGEYGYIFADLIDHKFTLERDASNVPAAIGTKESSTRTIIDVQLRKEAGITTKEVIMKREIFCPLILANSSPLNKYVTGNRRRLAKVPALLPALRALFDFQRAYSRLPDSNIAADLAIFTAGAKSHAQQLQLPDETLTADFLRAFIPALGAELPTTASFIGSRLSEDVINAITHREQPIQNFAFFDGESGPIYCLYSPPPEVILGTTINEPTQTNGTSNGTTRASLNDAPNSEMASIKFPPEPKTMP